MSKYLPEPEKATEVTVPQALSHLIGGYHVSLGLQFHTLAMLGGLGGKTFCHASRLVSQFKMDTVYPDLNHWGCGAVQQQGSYWNKSLALPLAGLEPREGTAYG